MARKTEDFLMIFLGVLMIGQYSNVQAEDYEGPLSVAEEEVLGKNAMADVEAESADSVSEPLRDPFWPVGYRPDGGSVDRETTSYRSRRPEIPVSVENVDAAACAFGITELSPQVVCIFVAD